MTQKAIIVKIWYDSEDYTRNTDPIDFIKYLLEDLTQDACKSGFDLTVEILKNEAIDNAFTELNDEIQELKSRMENHTKRLHEIEKVLEDTNLWSFE